MPPRSKAIAVVTREMCGLCHEVNRIGFSVPDKIWLAATGRHSDKVICIACFARLADERFVDWDSNIRLYPVSQRTHISALLETLDILSIPGVMKQLRAGERDIKAGRVHNMEDVRRDVLSRRSAPRRKPHAKT